ncbi:MAG: LSU ribosomal protein L34p, partial [uncultured Thermomicrobiales bacterium]
DQADLPTEADHPQAEARLPGTDGDQVRPRRALRPPPQRPPRLDGLRRGQVHAEPV